jgi:hypothetical protein
MIEAKPLEEIISHVWMQPEPNRDLAEHVVMIYVYCWQRTF